MAPGENPAPFVVTGNLAGNRAGAIRMWHAKWSFTVGFLLSAGSAIAVAETDIQAGQAPQSRALSVAEFAKLMGDATAVSTPEAPAPAPVQTTRNPTHQQANAPVRQTGERRVFSLVGFVEKAAAEGTAGEIPRVSLVDLVANAAEPTAEAAPAPVSTETTQDEEIVAPIPAPVVETAARASAAPAVVPIVRPVPSVAVARQAEAVEPRVAIVTPSNSQPVVEHREIARSAETARRPDEGVPPVSLAQHTTNASNVDQASLALPLSVSGDAPARQDSVSFERLDLTDSDARSGTLRLADAVRSALN